jgi:GH15 family glucan-1,4-alpha-glucosidase
MALYSAIPLQQHSEDVASQFTLRAGEKVTFVFGGVRPQGQQPEMEFIEQRFHETARFWRGWIAKSKYKGRWREMVNRSALMLKLLISREHGSLIAAPTFSLPEEIGGVRNWDYRFTWLRDATFTLYALIRLGFVEEAEAFIDWLKGRLSDDAERARPIKHLRDPGVSGIDSHKPAYLISTDLPSMPSPALVRDDG